MKSSLLLLLITLISFSSKICAQDFIPGLKIGTCISSFKTDYESSPLVGINAGFSFTSQMSDMLDIVTEFQITQTGGYITGREVQYSNLLDNYNDIKIQKNEFIWGFLFNIYVIPPTLSIQFGPMITLLDLGNKQDPNLYDTYFGNGDDINNYIQSSIVHNAYLDTKIDYGIDIGITGGTEEVKVNLRYHLGLQKYSAESVFAGSSASFKRNYFQLSLAYNFTNYRARF